MINAEAVSAFGSLRLPWPEYLMEAGELALYMFFACTFATLFHHPASPFGHLIVRAALRRLLTGLALGATASSDYHVAVGQTIRRSFSIPQ
jgi:hypothetical protein